VLPAREEMISRFEEKHKSVVAGSVWIIVASTSQVQDCVTKGIQSSHCANLFFDHHLTPAFFQ
jgi:hypothetical protein